MSENLLLLVLIILGVMIGNFISTLIISVLFPKPVPNLKFSKGDMVNIIDELNALIKLEFIAVVEAPNMVRQIDYISDIEKIQKEIVKNVVNGLSTKFFIMCNNAGMKREYILRYVTRKTLYEIWGYIKEHNFTPKKG